MISRTMRRHLLRGLTAASVAALTTGTAVATVGAPSSEQKEVELPAIELPAPTDDGDADSAAPATDGSEAVADDSLEAASTGAEMRSDTATAVQEVITATPPEERGAEFGAAVAEAASGGRAGGPEADDTSADDIDTSDEDDVDTSDDMDTHVDPAEAAADSRRDGDHRPN